MECHACQNLYHQNCHNPTITDEEASDPRLVWNCSSCNVNIQNAVRSFNKLGSIKSQLINIFFSDKIYRSKKWIAKKYSEIRRIRNGSS